MTAQRLAQVEEIYHAVLEVAPGEWLSFLASSCGDDAELRREVESLLSFANAPNIVIDEPPLDVAAEMVSEHQRPNIIGKKIRHYNILSQIGTGGMGDVFLATDTALERKVAIKFVSAEFAQDVDRVRRFMQEAKMASALNHPNILTVHEISKTKKAHFIATEYIDGKTLRKAMSDGELSFDDSIDIAAQVASALIAAHTAGIFHRDIKPENIMLRDDKLVKVLDFGLAKLQKGDWRTGAEEKMRRGESEKVGNGDPGSLPHLLTLSPSHLLPFSHVPLLTSPGLIMGTFAYMSPEQAVGNPTDARSDIWSLGVVMFEMFAGNKPFTGTTSDEVVDAIMNIEAEILDDDVPTHLKNIIHKAIRKAPENRYQTAAELLLDINGIRDLSSVSADNFVASAPGVSSAEYLVHEIKRHKIAAVAFLVLLLAVSVSAFFYFDRTPILNDKDTILIADFQNLTDDAVFTGTLERELALQLTQSPFLSLLPEAETKDTLRLIGDGAGKGITPEIAREICLRQNLKVFITGSFAPLGNYYLVTLKVIDVQTGGTIITEQNQAESKEQVLNSLDKTASSLREKLGESLASIKKFDGQNGVATTTSLEAMRAYSMAMESYAKGGNKDEAVVSLFQLAIKLDPNFALAYRDLSRHQYNIGRVAEATASITKAFELREQTSENEKLSIEVLYYEFATNDLEKAAETAELWKRTFPRLWQPYHYLSDIYFGSGQYEKSIENGREAIRLNPNFAAVYTNPAGALFRLGRFAEAKELYRQAMANNLDHLAYHFFLFWIGYFEHDSTALQQQIDWMRTHDYKHFAYAYESQLAMIEGRWKQSLEFSRLTRTESAKYREMNLGDQAFVWDARTGALFGDCRTAKQRANRVLSVTENNISLTDAAFALAMCGEEDRVLKIADTLASRFPKDKVLNELRLPTVRAAVELRRNRPDQALELLLPAADYQGRFGNLAPFVKGMALLRKGRNAEAATEFQNIYQHPGTYEQTPLVVLSHLWEARSLALTGDTTGSRVAYEEFLSLWKDADADLPTLIEAKKEYQRLKMRAGN